MVWSECATIATNLISFKHGLSSSDITINYGLGGVAGREKWHSVYASNNVRLIKNVEYKLLLRVYLQRLGNRALKNVQLLLVSLLHYTPPPPQEMVSYLLQHFRDQMN